MKMKNNISIVIPAYNVELYICDAIDSILCQTVLPFEVIIIDDGSTDNTPKLLRNYIKYDFITVIHTENKGQGAARNTGFNNSKSEYLYFFDADDILEPSFIEDMYSIINNLSAPDIILFSGRSFYCNNYKPRNFTPDYNRKTNQYFTDSYNLINILFEMDSFFPSPCLYIIKKELWVKKNLYFKAIVHEDDEILFKMLAFCNTAYVTEKIYFNRRIRHSSIMTSKKSKNNIYGLLCALETMYVFKNENPTLYINLSPLWKKNVARITTKILSVMLEIKRPAFSFNLIRSLFHIETIRRLIRIKK